MESRLEVIRHWARKNVKLLVTEFLFDDKSLEIDRVMVAQHCKHN
jgi:hypothetical protein